MISNLFKPAWKSSSPDKRLNAVQALTGDSQEDQDILSQLCDDPEPSVCAAAVARLKDVSKLFELGQQHGDDTVRAASLERFKALIGDAGLLDAQKARELMQSKPASAPLLATHAAQPELRIEALGATASDQLVGILSDTSFTDVRQVIAEKIDTLDDLEAARKSLRGKDKNAERILKTRIDAIRLEMREQEQHEEQVSRLIDEAEYLSTHDWLPEFKARVTANTNQWDRLQRPVGDSDTQRYNKARKIMDERFEQQRRIDETHAAQDRLLSELASMAEHTAKTELDVATAALDSTIAALDLLRLSWVELKNQAEPESAKQDRYQLLTGALEASTRLLGLAAQGLDKADNVRAMTGALENLNWPTALPEFKSAKQLQQRIADHRLAMKQAEKDRKEELDRLHKKVSSISRFAKAGHLGRARQIHAKVEKALDRFSGNDRQRLADRLTEAGETLGKMDDWKNFATEPKYVELCEAMEALAQEKLHPDNLAGKIKALQKQWKALGYSAISDQYWPRFKQAADKAYEPCAEFFSERHEVRQKNLQNRHKHVERLQQLLDQTNWDDNPDYKAAQDAVRKISDDFNAIKDVERGEDNKQRKAFSKLRDAVFAHLDVAYDNNIAAKQRLVEQATALAETEAKEDNLDKLKMLQTRWKQIGITRRKDDQKAWKAFKAQGDLVFEKIQALRGEKRAHDDQQLDAYRKLIKDIDALAAKANELADVDHRFAELQQAYEALPPLPENLPEKLVRGITRDYQGACGRIDKQRQRIIRKHRRAELDALRERASLCLKIESLNDSTREQELPRLEAQWDAVELHDHDLLRRIDERRKAAHKPADRAAIAAERRLLCIRLEIATGQDSPAEDRSLRTRYQLEQMNQSGLGQGALDISDDLEQVEIDWLCMPGAEASEQGKLDQRFYKVLGKSG
jgi:exonuclease SbcC